MQPDRALIAAAAAGDRRAFDALVRLHTPRMYRVALGVVGEAADAEDVVQEAWVSAWRGLPAFRGDAAPATWLYRVVSNAAVAHVRRRRPTVPFAADDEDRLTVADDPDGPERSALRAERAAHVHRAIDELDPAHRVPLVLREFEGLTYEEVAAVLDLSLPAVRSRLHRARQALLAKLEAVR